tara:strand:- start:267 stop:383 length:117 start_codon:yes stop_codon:yes gene_type:complete
MTTNNANGRSKAKPIGISMMIKSFFAATKLFLRNQINR